MNTYEKWIVENVADPKARCQTLTVEMQKTFPELIRIRGFYHCPLTGKHEHWWLKTPTNKIVDPTITQFLSSTGTYEEWQEGQPEPTGKCLNCGEYTYRSNYFCCQSCAVSFRESLK